MLSMSFIKESLEVVRPASYSEPRDRRELFLWEPHSVTKGLELRAKGPCAGRFHDLLILRPPNRHIFSSKPSDWLSAPLFVPHSINTGPLEPSR